MGFFRSVFNKQITKLEVLIISVPFSCCWAFLSYLKKRGLQFLTGVGFKIKTYPQSMQLLN